MNAYNSKCAKALEAHHGAGAPGNKDVTVEGLVNIGEEQRVLALSQFLPPLRHPSPTPFAPPTLSLSSGVRLPHHAGCTSPYIRASPHSCSECFSLCFHWEQCQISEVGSESGVSETVK